MLWYAMPTGVVVLLCGEQAGGWLSGYPPTRSASPVRAQHDGRIHLLLLHHTDCTHKSTLALVRSLRLT